MATVGAMMILTLQKLKELYEYHKSWWQICWSERDSKLKQGQLCLMKTAMWSAVHFNNMRQVNIAQSARFRMGARRRMVVRLDLTLVPPFCRQRLV